MVENGGVVWLKFGISQGFPLVSKSNCDSLAKHGQPLLEKCTAPIIILNSFLQSRATKMQSGITGQ